MVVVGRRREFELEFEFEGKVLDRIYMIYKMEEIYK